MEGLPDFVVNLDGASLHLVQIRVVARVTVVQNGLEVLGVGGVVSFLAFDNHDVVVHVWVPVDGLDHDWWRSLLRTSAFPPL